jgi:hypothetical protein
MKHDEHGINLRLLSLGEMGMVSENPRRQNILSYETENFSKKKTIISKKTLNPNLFGRRASLGVLLPTWGALELRLGPVHLPYSYPLL